MTNGEKVQQDFECEVCEPIIEDDIIHVIFADKPHSAIGFDWSWWNAECKAPTTKTNLAVDKEQLKTMIRGLTKWYVKRDNTEVGEPDTAVGLLYDDVMFGIDRLAPATLQKPKTGHWIPTEYDSYADGNPVWDKWECSECGCEHNGEEDTLTAYCPDCGAKMESEVRNEL